jgi:DNA-binding NtrC family response regulator
MLRKAVRDMEFVVETAMSAEEALARLEERSFDVVLTDLRLPRLSGLELCRLIRDRWPSTQAVILTGHGDLDAAQRAIRLDVVDFLVKPASLADIEAALERAIRRRRANIVLRDTEHATGEMLHDPKRGQEDSHATRLHDLEREHILDTLARFDGNRSATASELGISVRTLYYRLAEYESTGHYRRKGDGPTRS